MRRLPADRARQPGRRRGPRRAARPDPAVDEIVSRYVGDKQFSNLPRKFKTSISWLVDTPYESNDISFLGVDHPSTAPASTSGSAGSVHQSDARQAARRLGAVGRGAGRVGRVVGIFRDYGYRRLRNRARLKFLVADWGVERFREVLEKDYLGRTLLDGPAPILPSKPIDHVGVHEQADGRHYGRRPGGRAGLRRAAQPAGRRGRGARQ
ncbi:hypothetical protein NKG94_42565 [Micromonospora sp. M12]